MINAVLAAVIVMLGLALARVHVVLSLFIGAMVGGLLAGLGLNDTMVAFQEGLMGGAQIALSYALLGAFAMAVAASGLPGLLAEWIVAKLGRGPNGRAEKAVKYSLLAGILAMAVMSQNLIPVHIAFIPLLIPPLLGVFNRLRIDRRAVACVITFGLITTYMFVPVGFGSIYLNEILLGNIDKAGMSTDGISIMAAMGIPALSMAVGMLVAVFITYRRPRDYAAAAEKVAVGAAAPASGSAAGAGDPIGEDVDEAELGSVSEAGIPDARPSANVSPWRIIVSIAAVIACFAAQLIVGRLSEDANALLVGALIGLAIVLLFGGVPWKKSDDVFTQGMQMMALIGFIMIAAQGFASVMQATGQVESLVTATADLFAGNKAVGAFALLLVGLVVTMGIGSSFSTLPIIATVYVPLCAALGFSPMATVALVGTAGALGDAGSPASDSTLGPTAGLSADGMHDHIRDSVIPTFLHFNLPLLAGGWIAAMIL